MGSYILLEEDTLLLGVVLHIHHMMLIALDYLLIHLQECHSIFKYWAIKE